MIKNLKALRVELCISQQQLANVIGVSQQSINKYENHNVEPYISTLIALADYFSTSADYIISNTDIRRKIEHVRPFDLNAKETDIIEKYKKADSREKKIIKFVLS